MKIITKFFHIENSPSPGCLSFFDFVSFDNTTANQKGRETFWLRQSNYLFTKSAHKKSSRELEAFLHLTKIRLFFWYQNWQFDKKVFGYQISIFLKII